MKSPNWNMSSGAIRWIAWRSRCRTLRSRLYNAGRSQMAAAFFNQIVEATLARAVSAGTRPGDRVHPEVVQAVRELGIDLPAAKPKLLTPELAQGAELLITWCCGHGCSFVPRLRRAVLPLAET